jgi:hypothetical protein
LRRRNLARRSDHLHARGRYNKKGLKMKSVMTRVITAAAVGLLAVSFAAPSFAQTRAKRTYVPQAEQGEYYGGYAQQQAAHPGAPAAVANQPGACFTDEGYGRYASCDGGGE